MVWHSRKISRRRCKKIPKEERLVLGTDLNDHVEEGNSGDEEVMGRCGLREMNVEGQTSVDFANIMELAISNTFFLKKPRHKVTYSSGGCNTQLDYILVRRARLMEVLDTKVIVGESVAKQHRMVVSKLVMWTKWRKKENLVDAQSGRN